MVSTHRAPLRLSRATPLWLWSALALVVGPGCSRPNPAYVVDNATEMFVPDGSRDGSPPSGVDITTGLVGWWSLDDTGLATADDHSGNGNQGRLVPPLSPTTSWKPGRVGWSLEIPDQRDAAVEVPASPSLDSIRTGLTITAWVYRTESVRSRHMTVLSRQMGTGNRETYTLAFQNDLLGLWMYSPSPDNDFNLRGGEAVPLDTWVHVALTWDGSVVKLYRDGTLVASKAHDTTLPPTSNPILLGNDVNGKERAQPLGGRLDEVRLYNRALSAAAIGAVMRAQGVTPAAPVSGG